MKACLCALSLFAAMLVSTLPAGPCTALLFGGEAGCCASSEPQSGCACCGADARHTANARARCLVSPEPCCPVPPQADCQGSLLVDARSYYAAIGFDAQSALEPVIIRPCASFASEPLQRQPQHPPDTPLYLQGHTLLI